MVSFISLALGAGLGYLTLYALVWLVYAGAGLLRESPPVEWEPAEVQARVLTVGDAPRVVQRTVDSLPETLGSVYVVSEQPLEIDGAEVRVVDEEFTCEAIDKGRALEWARRTLPTEEEYVLFLDEDTVVEEFAGLPDADIVQFAEKPQPDGSLAAWLTEVFRVGNGVERAGFGKRVPLLGRLVPIYCWGGGGAVRKSTEDAVTWERETIVEDSAFMRDAIAAGHSYAVRMTRFENRAPPNLQKMVSQRRRWGSGRLRDARQRPLGYRLLLYFHTLGRPLLSFSLLLVVAGLLVSPTGLTVLALLVLGFLLLWTLLGWRVYADTGRPWLLPALLLALPLTTAANGAGDLYALLSPVSEFETTGEGEP